MRGRKVVTSVMALGLSLSGQVLAQGAPQPAPAPAKPVPVPAPAPPVAPEPNPVAPAPAAPPAIAPAPAPAPPPGPAPVAPPGPVPTPPDASQAPPPPAEPTPAPLPPPVMSDPEPHASVDPEPDLPAPESYSEGGDSWYDLIEFSAFVDAYASVNYNFPKPQTGKNGLRAHDKTNGFSLAWVGVNASYPADPVGGTISLRFGPSARQIAACFATETPCDSDVGLENVKQGFVSWKPGGADSSITLDLGKFDTPFGVEVAESHLNLNYTRSMLYASQPVTHTGLRANFAVADAFDFRVLAVNGWNNSIDNNVGKSLGAQATFHVKNAGGSDLLTASLGYMVGPEHDDVQNIECPDGTRFEASSSTGCVASASPAGTVATSGLVDRASSNTEGLRHLLDLVVTADPIERLRLVLNANFGRDTVRSSKTPSEFDGTNYYGVLLGARLAIVDAFGVAARGEFFHDSNGYISGEPDEEMNLVGGTLTLELLPADFLTLRLDNRVDWASKQIFDKELRDKGGYQFTTTLGVVGHTN